MSEEKFTDLRIDVEVMKRDIDTLTSLCEKMDKVIEKLVNHQEIIINQIYQDMDKRKTDTNQDIRELHNKIDGVRSGLSDSLEETENRLMEEMKSLRQEIKAHNLKESQEFKELESQVDKILQWKWTIVGGIVVISWLTSNIGIDTILKMLIQ